MITVQCIAHACQASFDIDPDRLGRFVTCPACSRLQPARPARVQHAITQLDARHLHHSGQPPPHPRIPLTLLLDDIRSCFNVGSIFRTADAIGLQQLILCGITPVPPDPRIAKTALGAENTVPWSYCADLLAACHQLLSHGHQLAALEATPHAHDLSTWQPVTPLALIVGNEVVGIQPPALDLATTHLQLPMYGHKASLNVAVATGAALYLLTPHLRS